VVACQDDYVLFPVMIRAMMDISNSLQSVGQQSAQQQQQQQ